MNIKEFVLSYYQNAAKDFHITRIVTPHEALKLHIHNYFQVYYVINGTIVHHIEDTTAKLTSGDVFILPPNLPHYIEVPEGKVDFYSMSFTPDFIQNTKESNKLTLDFLHYLNTEVVQNVQPKLTLAYEDSVFVEELLGRILKEFLEKKAGNGEIIKACVSVILSMFARVYFEETVQTLKIEENRQLVMHCIGYIKNHYDEELTLGEMVQLSAMSKTNFCAIFTSITGTTFKDYLNRCRIENAVVLLQGGEMVSSVSIRCGYNDLSTFHRNFKKYKGVSPSYFIQEHRKENNKSHSVDQ